MVPRGEGEQVDAEALRLVIVAAVPLLPTVLLREAGDPELHGQEPPGALGNLAVAVLHLVEVVHGAVGDEEPRHLEVDAHEVAPLDRALHHREHRREVLSGHLIASSRWREEGEGARGFR